MMKPAYSKRQQRLYFRALIWLAAWLYRLAGEVFFRRMPATILNQEAFDSLNAQPRKGIAVPWHCCVAYGLWVTRNLGVAVMASRSNAGSVAAAIVRRLGGIAVRGGSRDGGEQALVEIVHHVNRGRWGLIVADAPRGPIHVCKIGPILAAQRTGRPILPVGFAAERHWTLNTWDRTIIPKPFSPVVWIWGDPFFVPPHLDRNELEAKRQELEEALRRVQTRALRFWPRPTEEDSP